MDYTKIDIDFEGDNKFYFQELKLIFDEDNYTYGIVIPWTTHIKVSFNIDSEILFFDNIVREKSIFRGFYSNIFKYDNRESNLILYFINEDEAEIFLKNLLIEKFENYKEKLYNDDKYIFKQARTKAYKEFSNLQPLIDFNIENESKIKNDYDCLNIIRNNLINEKIELNDINLIKEYNKGIKEIEEITKIHCSNEIKKEKPSIAVLLIKESEKDNYNIAVNSLTKQKFDNFFWEIITDFNSINLEKLKENPGFVGIKYLRKKGSYIQKIIEMSKLTQCKTVIIQKPFSYSYPNRLIDTYQSINIRNYDCYYCEQCPFKDMISNKKAFYNNIADKIGNRKICFGAFMGFKKEILRINEKNRWIKNDDYPFRFLFLLINEIRPQIRAYWNETTIKDGFEAYGNRYNYSKELKKLEHPFYKIPKEMKINAPL